MANYNFESSGRLFFDKLNLLYDGSGRLGYHGTGYNCVLYHFTTKYSERSIVFSRKKAFRGILSPVVIKKILFYTQYHYLYVDNYNAYWTNNLLLSRDDAVEVAQAYLTNELEKVNYLLSQV